MTNKIINYKYSSIMSKKLLDMSEVMDLLKTTFTDILNMLRKGKIRIEPYAQILDRLNRAEKTTQDIIDNWKACFQQIPLTFGPKDDKNSLVTIQFEFTG